MQNVLSSILPEKYAKEKKIFPISIEENRFKIQMSKFDIETINDLKIKSGMEILVDKVSEDVICENIKKYYENDNINTKGNSKLYFYKMLQMAVEQSASDIHIEPFENHVNIRFRINGEMQTIDKISNDIYSMLVTVIKLESNKDITEKRIPQDGRFEYKSEEENVDIRVSIVPTVFGEKIVMRILNRNTFLKSMKCLGFDNEAIKKIKKISSINQGIFIISGVTGSGKTTTVYSILKTLNDGKKNIMTIENPVEYKIEGINQIQTNFKLGLDFEEGLKAILRQDPDIIILGEIRDVKTAQTAIRAAITGHFVLSTVHTSSAIATVERILDMGVEPYMLSAALTGVISQKLVKNYVDGKCVSRSLQYEILEMDEVVKDAIKNLKLGKDLKYIAEKRGLIYTGGGDNV